VNLLILIEKEQTILRKNALLVLSVLSFITNIDLPIVTSPKDASTEILMYHKKKIFFNEDK
jgi:hypothetical protein